MAQIPNPFGESAPTTSEKGAGSSAGLAAYCMTRVENGRRSRDTRHGERWKEYTRLWRGRFIDSDKNTDSERSQLIAPALQQAVEMTVAEMEEAVFNRKAWFDITDDLEDQEKEDAIAVRDSLIEDFQLAGVPEAVSMAFLLGALYGTGIIKINVVNVNEKVMGPGGKMVIRPLVRVFAYAVRPDEFVIDPTALNIDEAEFCAHEMVKPWHGIRAKQLSGAYGGATVAPYMGPKGDSDGTGRHSTAQVEDNGVLITEYYGQVPARLVPGASGKGLIEALVTIANGTTVLRAVESPFTMQDRPIVAYQHDTVPGEFWGRGVCEKGYNPQKALDAELRARIDALALLSAPMMGADITRLPRNGDMRVRPGKTVFTRGRPSEILEPISFGHPSILANTFQHTGDLERMVQMGTGAMDSATPIGINSRNETASGMSQLQAGFIKRSKRTMQNLERQCLGPLIRKSLWRYIQFAPQRYGSDMKFVVNATMGIMAKEVENAQLINMLGYVPSDSPAHPILIQAIFDNSASANKKELAQAIKAMSAPPSQEEQDQQKMMKQIQQQIMLAEAKKAQALAEKEAALVQKALADTKLALAKANHVDIQADLEDDMIEIQAANAVTAAEKARVAKDVNAVNRERNIVESQRAASRNTIK